MTRYLAELVGTAVPVLIGCGAVTIGGLDGRTFDVIGIAFAFGLAVTGMALIGPVSGRHIDPAVTAALPAREAIGYVVAQLVGSVIGAALLVLILKGKLASCDVDASGLGRNGWGASYLGGDSLGAAILTEFLATLIFTIVILGITNPTADVEVGAS
jgi:aquaporin Z